MNFLFLTLFLFVSPSFAIERAPHGKAYCAALYQTLPKQSASEDLEKLIDQISPQVLNRLEVLSSGPKTKEQNVLLFLNTIRPQSIGLVYQQWRNGRFDMSSNYDQTVLAAFKNIQNREWTPALEKSAAAVLGRLSQLRADLQNQDQTVISQGFEIRGQQNIKDYLGRLKTEMAVNDQNFKTAAENKFPNKGVLLKGALTLALSGYAFGHGLGFLLEPLPQHVGVVVGGVLVSIKALVSAILYYLGKVFVYPHLKEAGYYWSGLFSKEGLIRYEEATTQERIFGQINKMDEMIAMLDGSLDQSDLIYNSFQLAAPQTEMNEMSKGRVLLEQDKTGPLRFFSSDQILFFDNGEPVLFNFLRIKNKILKN